MSTKDAANTAAETTMLGYRNSATAILSISNVANAHAGTLRIGLQCGNITVPVQADEILPKTNVLKQYYVRKQELFYFRMCSCDVTYSSSQ